MSRNYRCVSFVNLSMSSLGVFSDECSTFLDMMNDIGIDKKQQRYIIKKMINIAIRATYYIFCCRNRNWDSPDLMQFWYIYIYIYFFFGFCLVLFLFFVFCFCFVFCFVFNNPISSSICKLPIRSKIVHSKTQVKFPLLLLLLLLLLLTCHCNMSWPLVFLRHCTCMQIMIKFLLVKHKKWHMSLLCDKSFTV